MNIQQNNKISKQLKNMNCFTKGSLIDKNKLYRKIKGRPAALFVDQPAFLKI